MRKILIIIVLLTFNSALKAQSTRINNDRNHICWTAYLGTIKIHKNWSIHTEYQFRRADWFNKWQQSLIRAGINYHFNKNFSVTLGYSEIETFEYGLYPFTKNSKPFSENRIYQQAQIKNPYKKLELTQRYRLEQRWIEKQKTDGSNDGIKYVNRFRYMLRADIPLYKELYLGVYDELLVSFGKEVRYNMFDQNRFGLLIGYKFSKLFKVEGGFYSQIVQQGSLKNISYYDAKTNTYTVLPSTVMQYNTGIQINAIFNFDLTKKVPDLKSPTP